MRQGSLPGTVRALLDDLEKRSGQLRDLGTVRMIECADPETARMLLLDPKLKTLCEPAGKRGIVFRATWNRRSKHNCENLVMFFRPADGKWTRESTSVKRSTIRLLALVWAALVVGRDLPGSRLAGPDHLGRGREARPILGQPCIPGGTTR